MNHRALNTTKEYREGYEAAGRDETYRDHCPYTFNRAGVDQRVFDAEYRQKMDAWFAGWKAWLDERGLRFNFKPVKKAKRK